jgi:pimeloyl-ACP methyl ester carboxylesterase
MAVRRRRLRRFLLFALLAVALVALYDLAVLSSTTAKVFRHGAAFDWWQGPVSRSTIRIGSITADVYSGSQSTSPLLFVHGVNETGKDSPEVKPIAEALAGSGFRVIVPDFVRLKRQNVTPADIDDIVAIVRSLGADTGILCASYGCGPALIAAARPEVRDRVQFIATFGAYFDLKETLRSIVTGPPSAWAYSKWIYMAANVDLVDNEEDRKRLLAIAAERQGKPVQGASAVGNLGPDAGAMLALAESSTAPDFDARLLKLPALQDRIERLSPSRYIADLRARLIIVHLRSDPSIPSSESSRMAEAAREHGILGSLTILEMNGHTHPEWPRPGIRSFFGFYVPQGWKFMRVLNEVLSYA